MGMNRLFTVWFAASISASVGLTGATRALATSAEPPRECSVRQGAWCIQTAGEADVSKIRSSGSSGDDDAWSIAEPKSSKSMLVVLAPASCGRVFSDQAVAVSFTPDIEWGGKLWDEMKVSLRHDGGCTLRLLVTPFRSGSDWGFSVGRAYLAACESTVCEGVVPTIVDATNVFRERFRH